MAEFPVVKGYTLRATKINSCGRPESGAANRLVTEGFVSFNLTPEMKAAEQLEQTNAAGKVCVKDRTPPERKWWNIEATLCNVNTELITLFTGWEQVVDFDDLPIGIRDRDTVEGDYGVALEVWTGGEGDDDCPIPTTDSIFSANASGKQYGYLLLGGKEFTLGNIEIGAAVSTFTISGISLAMPQWGRGPYNVAAINSDGDAGRLLAPTGKKEHITLFRTPIAPPEATEGAVPLDILGKFTGSDYYFGGPANAPAIDVAPDQGDPGDEVVLSFTGGPATGGTFSLTARYPGGLEKETAAIAFGANAATIKAALVLLDDGYDAADWDVVGALPAGVTITPPQGVTVTDEDNALTPATTIVVV